MDKNYYRILKELNSLKMAIPPLEKVISKELARISRIQRQRELRNADLLDNTIKHDLLSKELRITESSITQISETLNKHQSTLKTVFSEAEINALNKQIEHSQAELDGAETRGLEIIDDLPIFEEKISHATTFLSGSLETIAEIEAEIKLTNADVYAEINIKKGRILNLFEQLPANVTKKIDSLTAKGPNFIPLSQIMENNTCQMCGYLVPMVLIASIEKHQRFHSCTACERILIPQSSKY